MPPVDVEGVERLYGLSLDEFVRERDALARELRKTGRRDEADEVKALPKPSLPTWAVNQLARECPEEMRRLLAAAERLRSAQVAGQGDFATAARAEQDAVRVLVRAAADVLRKAGRPATDATLSRVGQTLHAAVADEDARADLERGTVRRELEPAGFGVFAGALPAQPAKRAPDRARPAPEPRERDRKREERKRLEADVKRARAEARELERVARQARARADKAHGEVDRLEKRLRDL